MNFAKAKIKNMDTGTIIDVMFNPTDYTESIEAMMDSPVGEVGKTASKSTQDIDPSFKKVTLKDFTIKLPFDTYNTKNHTKEDVRNLTQKIADLVMPNVPGKTKKRPPVCLFLWGNFSFKGTITRVDRKFTMFLADGTPVRAELTVNFKTEESPEEKKLNQGLDACRKIWKVKGGDRLDLIAHRTLKNPNLWRKIAEENNIIDPLEFPTIDDIGKTLIIPD